MGYYIQTSENHNKAQYIVKELGGRILPSAPNWGDKPTDMAIVCVVDNGMFEAAGLAYNLLELAAFKHPDGRRKTWLFVPKDIAHKAAGYEGT